MSRRGPESFIKRQREIKRKQKAQAKMARRHGKNKQDNDATKSEIELWLEKNRKLDPQDS